MLAQPGAVGIDQIQTVLEDLKAEGANDAWDRPLDLKALFIITPGFSPGIWKRPLPIPLPYHYITISLGFRTCPR